MSEGVLQGEVVLQAEGLTRRFHEGRGPDGLDVTVLHGVDLTVHRRRDGGHRGRLRLGQEHAAAPAGRRWTRPPPAE
jgi:hypothetical protein